MCTCHVYNYVLDTCHVHDVCMCAHVHDVQVQHFTTQCRSIFTLPVHPTTAAVPPIEDM